MADSRRWLPRRPTAGLLRKLFAQGRVSNARLLAAALGDDGRVRSVNDWPTTAVLESRRAGTDYSSQLRKRSAELGWGLLGQFELGCAFDQCLSC
jgi:hypothetical protein